MKLWLDDVRKPPDESWHWVKSVRSAVITTMMAPELTHMSLDHDLGENERPGIKLLDVMALLDIWPTVEIRVHSMNPVGVQQMMALIDRYGPYTQRPASNVRMMG